MGICVYAQGDVALHATYHVKTKGELSADQLTEGWTEAESFFPFALFSQVRDDFL